MERDQTIQRLSIILCAAAAIPIEIYHIRFEISCSTFILCFFSSLHFVTEIICKKWKKEKKSKWINRKRIFFHALQQSSIFDVRLCVFMTLVRKCISRQRFSSCLFRSINRTDRFSLAYYFHSPHRFDFLGIFLPLLFVETTVCGCALLANWNCIVQLACGASPNVYGIRNFSGSGGLCGDQRSAPSMHRGCSHVLVRLFNIHWKI